MSKYVKISAVAEFLSVKERTIRAYVLYRKIPYYKINGVLLFKLEEIDEWVKKGKVLPLGSKET